MDGWGGQVQSGRVEQCISYSVRLPSKSKSCHLRVEVTSSTAGWVRVPEVHPLRVCDWDMCMKKALGRPLHLSDQ